MNVTGAGPGFGLHIVDVAVDKETGRVDIKRYTVVEDAGKAIHRLQVEGQFQGGAVQGIGWALNEEYYYGEDGRMQNPSFLDYRMPVASDVPMIDTEIVEIPNPRHPYGLRGVGEVPVVPTMAAIANAVGQVHRRAPAVAADVAAEDAEADRGAQGEERRVSNGSPPAVRGEAALLVHGHGAPSVLLEPLRRALELQGFRAVNWPYRSLWGSIEAHAANLAVKAQEFNEDIGVERLHFVGHSMGAIVVRRALAMARPRKLGRVVLLAPPNRGARLADFALRLFGRRLCAAMELCSHPDSYVNRLPPATDLECGIIAASWDQVVSLELNAFAR